MSAPVAITDNYGQMPDIERLALVVASTSATAVVELLGKDGRSLTVPVTITITSTAQSIVTILATASVVWDKSYEGMKIISVATADVFYNYGAKLAGTDAGSSTSYTATVVKAPTTASLKIPVGDYSTQPWVAGRVAGN